MKDIIKIIIVDDHPTIREGIKSSLENFSIKVTGEAENGAELLKKIQKTPRDFDVILLDINLPDKSGFEIMEQLKTKEIPIPVLIFSVAPEKDYALRAIKAGAKGYIQKVTDFEEIAEAIKKVVSGKSYMSDTVQEMLRLEIESGGKSDIPHHNLSNREFEVMLLFSKGMKNKEIAEKLNISEKTASEYRKRIKEKMCFTNDADLIKYVINHKLDPEG